jgi:hypothetical protein
MSKATIGGIEYNQCNHCGYDEAEGGLWRQCSDCLVKDRNELQAALAAKEAELAAALEQSRANEIALLASEDECRQIKGLHHKSVEARLAAEAALLRSQASEAVMREALLAIKIRLHFPVNRSGSWEMEIGKLEAALSGSSALATLLERLRAAPCECDKLLKGRHQCWAFTDNKSLWCWPCRARAALGGKP